MTGLVWLILRQIGTELIVRGVKYVYSAVTKKSGKEPL